MNERKALERVRRILIAIAGSPMVILNDKDVHLVNTHAVTEALTLVATILNQTCPVCGAERDIKVECTQHE